MRRTYLLCLTLAATVAMLNGCGGGGSNANIPGTSIASSSPPSPVPAGSPPPPTGSPTKTPPASPFPTTRPTSTAHPTPTVTPSPVPSSGVARHLATWAYDEYGGQGDAGTPAQAQTYLTYAEGFVGNTKAVDDCHGSNACFSVFYFLANFVLTNGSCTGPYSQQLFATATESWYMHQSGFTDFAHRLIGHRRLQCNGVFAPQPVYALNNFSPGYISFVQSYLRTNADAFDFYLMDETSGTNLTQFYGPGGGMCPAEPFPHLCPTTQEYPNDAAVVRGHDTFFDSLTHTSGAPMKVFFNGVTFINGNPTDLGIVAGGKEVFGAMCEDCVVRLGQFRPNNFVSVLNAMAEMNAIPGGSFIELNIGNAPGGSSEQIEERTTTAAVAWLGYSPGHTIVFPDLEYNTKGLAIWPEYNIVPTGPLQTMSGSYSAVQVASHVYRREFSACYNFGTPIGPCAAIVNGQTSVSITISPAWLKQSYRHVIALSGGDIPSGGTISVNSKPFVASATTLAPGHAILIAR